jgi:hypothetical protein
MRGLPPYGSDWRRKIIGGALVVVLAPLLLTTLVQSVNEIAGMVLELLGQLVPAAIGVVVLIVLCRLLFGQRYR